MQLALVHSIKEVDGVLRISSRDIAEARGRTHDRALRVIDRLIAKDPTLGLTSFGETPFTDPQNGQQYREYLCDEEASILLAMNLGGVDALAFQRQIVQAFIACRNKLKAAGIPAPAAVNQLDILSGMFDVLKKHDSRLQVIEGGVKEARLLAESAVDKAAQASRKYPRRADFNATLKALYSTVYSLPLEAAEQVRYCYDKRIVRGGYVTKAQYTHIIAIAKSAGVLVYEGGAA